MASLSSLPDILYGHAVAGLGMIAAPALPSNTLQASSESGQGTDSVAGIRRKKQNSMLPHRDRDKKDLLFGFNKIAVCLSTGLVELESLSVIDCIITVSNFHVFNISILSIT